ncbi:MAG: DUF2281 domain-containing protein [Bacteroidetes bacterium]|nr:DUF2281 domain-containing protein [Bacteroidota bacterium]
MSTTELIEMISKLPSDKQKEVEDFISSLVAGTHPGDSKVQRGYGSMKGLIKYMADDFDAPLEDFKDYM